MDYSQPPGLRRSCRRSVNPLWMSLWVACRSYSLRVPPHAARGTSCIAAAGLTSLCAVSRAGGVRRQTCQWPHPSGGAPPVADTRHWSRSAIASAPFHCLLRAPIFFTTPCLSMTPPKARIQVTWWNSIRDIQHIRYLAVQDPWQCRSAFTRSAAIRCSNDMFTCE